MALPCRGFSDNPHGADYPFCFLSRWIIDNRSGIVPIPSADTYTTRDDFVGARNKSQYPLFSDLEFRNFIPKIDRQNNCGIILLGSSKVWKVFLFFCKRFPRIFAFLERVKNKTGIFLRSLIPLLSQRFFSYRGIRRPIYAASTLQLH